MKQAARELLQALKAHRADLEPLHLRDLFERDPDRAKRYSRRRDDLTVDFSKTRSNGRTIELLLDLAVAAEVTALQCGGVI